MHVIAESPVHALRNEFREAAQAPLLARLRRSLALHWQRRRERAMAARLRRTGCPDVQAGHIDARWG